MDGWVRVLRPFNSISVISRRWKGEHERLCAMKRRLGSRRISPPAGFELLLDMDDIKSESFNEIKQNRHSASEQPSPGVWTAIHIYPVIRIFSTIIDFFFFFFHIMRVAQPRPDFRRSHRGSYILYKFTSLFLHSILFTKATWGTLKIQHDTRLIVQTTHIRNLHHSY